MTNTQQTIQPIKQKQGRYISWDILRIISMLPTAFIHTAVHDYDVLVQGSGSWLVCNFFSGLFRYCIPLLFMVSGAFLLDAKREYSFKKLYGQKISRLLVAYIFWAVLYSFIGNLVEFQTINSDFIKSFIRETILGHYHLWFILAMISVYMIVPFLRLIAKDVKLIKYFLLLWLFFTVFVKILFWVPHTFVDEIKTFLIDFDMNFVVGYSGYFLLGYYLRTNEISKRTRIIIYISAIVTTAIAIVVNVWCEGTSVEVYSNHAPSSILSAVAILLFVNKWAAKHKMNEKLASFISTIAPLGFGVYLTHDLFIILFMDVFGLNTITMPLVMIPIISIMVLVAGYGFTYLIRKIPVIGKWIC